MRVGSTLRLALGLAVVLSARAEAEEQAEEFDAEAFREQVRPLIRDYIFGRYQQFRDSELTFRDIKQHIAPKFGMTYAELKADHLR